jgi:ADP-ribose pyrophosphatase YjhB (NUDIX family)
MTKWRPPPTVRPISIGIVRRGGDLLLMAVRTDDGAIKGWRPLGGSIEFGEHAADTLKREFSEELGLAIAEPRLLSVLENLFTHHDAAGHEIVFVFEATLADGEAYRRDAFTFEDRGVRNDVSWVALARFQAGQELLFPTGLLELIEASGRAERPLHQSPP